MEKENQTLDSTKEEKPIGSEKEEPVEELPADAEPEPADEESKQPEAPKAPAEDAEEQPSKLNAQNAELNDRLLRVCAEYDNYKKRTQREKQEIATFTKGLCIQEMLKAMDNFERALAADCKDKEFKKGMEMILAQLNDAVKSLGATEIEALHQPFNPEFHNAISQIKDESLGENIVSEVLQKGYLLDGKVIRHAMVVVANP